MQTIGRNIKKFRELRNLTREHLAAEMDMSVSGYSKIERGEVNLSMAKISRIAGIFGVDVSLLLDFNPSNVLNSPPGTVPAQGGTDYREKYIQMLEAELARLRDTLESRLRSFV